MSLNASAAIRSNALITTTALYDGLSGAISKGIVAGLPGGKLVSAIINAKAAAFAVSLGAIDGAAGGSVLAGLLSGVASTAVAAAITPFVLGLAAPYLGVGIAAMIGAGILTGLVSAAVGGGLNAIIGNWDAISDFGQGVYDQIRDLGSKVGEALNHWADKAQQAAGDLYNNAADALSDLWDSLSDALGDIGLPDLPSLPDWFPDLPGLFGGLPDLPSLPDWFPDLPGLLEELPDLPSLPDWFKPGGIFYFPPICPLVLDVDGDGLDIISLDKSHAYFDLNENGFAERTAWIGAEDGFLALDINGNGKIDDLSELFGSKDIDGFTMLAKHDLNNDGVIDINDPVFKNLLVWRDADGDGLTDAGELVSLESLGITSINLKASDINKWMDENWISHRSQYTKADGSTGIIDDIWFANSQVQTIYRYGEEQDFSFESFFLPELLGYGKVRNLSVAMAEDAEFAAAVKTLTGQSVTMPASELCAAIEALLLKWAGVDGVDPGSRGGRVDARHLAFLEAVHGQNYVAYGGGAIPQSNAVAGLESYYDAIIASYTAKFLVQLPLAALFLDNITAIGDHPFAFLAEITYDRIIDRLMQVPASVLDAISSKLTEASAIERLGGLDILWALRIASGLDDGAYKEVIKSELISRGVDANTLEAFGKNIKTGTDANDTLSGSAEADVIAGGHGNDTLNGGSGNDTYYYARGDGHDTITEASNNGMNDRLVFTDLNPEDMTLRRYGSDVILVIAESYPGAGDAGSVVLKAELGDESGQGIEQIIFADGTVWTQATLRQWASLLGATHQGTDGDDIMIGSLGNDVLDGGAGDDSLKGGDGSDIYIFGRGYGNDTIIETTGSADTDIIQLLNLDPEDVTVSRTDDNLLITINASGEVLTVQYHFYSTAYGVEQLVFADGTVWDRATIQKEAWHRGGDGNDTLAGSASNDTLDGGAGDDILKGDYGSDTYRYGAGYGNDTIIENGSSGADTDIIRLVGLNPTDVTVSRTGDNLLITIDASGEVLTVQYHFYSTAYGVEQLVFADGTVWDRATIQKEAWHRGGDGNDTLAGSASNDTLDGGAGDDILKGDYGSDTYRYGAGYGNDTIIENGSSGADTDIIRLVGLNPTDVTVSRTGDNLLITINASGEVLTVQYHFYSTAYGVEQLVFADGTVWDRATIQKEAWHRGGDGNDTLAGSASNDTLDGGAGDDILKGDYGSDTYRYGAGYGNDTIIENGSSGADTDIIRLVGLNPTDVTVSRTGDNLLITINASGEVLTVQYHFYSTAYGMEQLVFADGTVWDRATIQKEAWHRGGDGNDTLAGSASNDTLDGGAGDDILKGDYGSDTYRYGAGYGNDTIIENGSSSADTDIIRLLGLNPTDVTVSRTGDNLLITINASGEVLTVQYHFYSTAYGVEQLVFADGTVWDRATIQKEAWHRGGDGNDTLAGSASNDTLDGGAGDDILKGDYGSDTYRYGAGYGNDIIIENGSSGADTDIIRLVGLNPTDVTVSRTGDNLLITINASGEVLTVQYHFYSTAYGMEQLVFADGTVWDRAVILQQVTSPAPVAAGMASFSMLLEDSDTFVFVAAMENLQDEDAGTMQVLDNIPLFKLDGGSSIDIALAHLEDSLAQDLSVEDQDGVIMPVSVTNTFMDDFRYVA